MTTSIKNENMDIDLTNKSNSNGNDDNGGEDFSKDSDGAENKGTGGGKDGSDDTTPTVPTHKLNLGAELPQGEFIPEEAKGRTTKDLTQ